MKKRYSIMTHTGSAAHRIAVAVGFVVLMCAGYGDSRAQIPDPEISRATAVSTTLWSLGSESESARLPAIHPAAISAAMPAVSPVRALSREDSVRTLAEYYARRAYPGAPPMIPHLVTNDASYGARTCTRCHTRNRYVPRFDAYTPLTPHPELLSCRSCHVPAAAGELFVETDWITPEPPVLEGGILDGSPPAIPHSLEFRNNCVACHAGPGSVPEIRSNHPERVNCRQCHVASVTDRVWNR